MEQVDDQNVEIKELKIRLLEIESKELKNLQKQIIELAKNNNKKEIAIKKLLEELESKCSHKETVEEQVELEERLDSSEESQDDIEEREREKESLEFMKKNWDILSELEAKLGKRRNAFGKLLRSYNCKIIEEEESAQ